MPDGEKDLIWGTSFPIKMCLVFNAFSLVEVIVVAWVSYFKRI